MTFSIIQGDLFDPEHNFDALAQGVNTYGIMGAGIAVPFRENWPEMYEEYKELCTKYGAHLGGTVHIWRPEPSVEPSWSDELNAPVMEVDFGQTIYNMFSQIAPGRDGDYALLTKAAIMIRQDAEDSSFDRVGLPWIGCGIAGLERHNVAQIFEYVLGDSEIEFILVQQDEIYQPPTEEELSALEDTSKL